MANISKTDFGKIFMNIFQSSWATVLVIWRMFGIPKGKRQDWRTGTSKIPGNGSSSLQEILAFLHNLSLAARGVKWPKKRKKKNKIKKSFPK